MKEIIYHSSAKKDISIFPDEAKQRIARLLEMLSQGDELQPNYFKYIPTVGAGTYELRIKTDKQYRVFYISKFKKAIYVLHAFVKKTQETPQKDIDKGKRRYKELVNYLKLEDI